MCPETNFIRFSLNLIWVHAFTTWILHIQKTWSPAPKLGNSVSKLSRKYFFSLALIFLALMSAIFFSGFPFDNLCPVKDFSDAAYYNATTIEYKHKFTDKTSIRVNVTVDENTQFYTYCNMNYLIALQLLPFPRFQERVSLEVSAWRKNKKDLFCGPEFLKHFLRVSNQLF